MQVLFCSTGLWVPEVAPCLRAHSCRAAILQWMPLPRVSADAEPSSRALSSVTSAAVLVCPLPFVRVILAWRLKGNASADNWPINLLCSLPMSPHHSQLEAKFILVWSIYIYRFSGRITLKVDFACSWWAVKRISTEKCTVKKYSVATNRMVGILYQSGSNYFWDLFALPKLCYFLNWNRTFRVNVVFL